MPAVTAPDREPVAGDFCHPYRDEGGFCFLALNGGGCATKRGECPMSRAAYHRAWCRLVDRAAARAKAEGGWLAGVRPINLPTSGT